MTLRPATDLGAAERFDKLTTRFLTEPDVSEGRMFGSPGLKIGTKIFAMLVKGELVVKLPRGRVDQLVASGDGTPFDPGHGRLMKEWVTSPPSNSRDWEQLTSEALEFVRSLVAHRRLTG